MDNYDDHESIVIGTSRERTFNTAGMKLWSAPIGGMGAEVTLRFNTETGWSLSTPAIRIPLTRGQIYDLKKAIEWGTERDLEQGRDK